MKERRDSGQGWDLLVRLINPLTDTILMDDIPVQCKNYVGSVTTSVPLDDLERCVRNSGKDLAYLFILGDLPPDFSTAVRLRQEALRTDLGRPVTLEVVDQDRIAELYAAYLVRPLRRTQSVV